MNTEGIKDEMTREELVDFIKRSNGNWTFVTESGKKVSKEQVIKALQQKPCADCVSRQELLRYFEGWKNQVKYYHPYAKNFDIPYEEAIQWVKDMRPVKCVSPENPNKCEDAISRQAVEEIINDIRACISVEGYWAILERVKKLSPVNSQESKTGQWIERVERDDWDDSEEVWYECDQCHTDWGGAVNFCPNCGAKMQEVKK